MTYTYATKKLHHRPCQLRKSRKRYRMICKDCDCDRISIEAMDKMEEMENLCPNRQLTVE